MFFCYVLMYVPMEQIYINSFQRLGKWRIVVGQADPIIALYLFYVLGVAMIQYLQHVERVKLA